MTSGHSASASAIGYLYQTERALLELVRRSGDADLTLFMERLDDFELETSGTSAEILQAKHHTGPGGDLTNMSVDLWRSIGVWVDLVDRLSESGQVDLVLLTTSSTPSMSAASLLQDEDRDPAAALTILEDAARQSTNSSTATARERFLGMDPAARARLVWSLHIRPAEPGLVDVEAQLVLALRLRVLLSASFHAAFIDRLKGWWYRESVRMLSDPEAGITSDDLARFAQHLRDSFHPEDLPPTIDFEDPTETEVENYRSSVFVSQLEWIAYSNEQLAIAIRDYHRAYAERSRWAREGILIPGELDRYEQRLVEQWQRVFEDMVTELAPEAGETREAAGRKLLQQLRDSSAVWLRPRYSEVFLTHGTLHGLANAHRVGWHPDFRERLQTLLIGNA